jgi:cysteine dioxygenase
MEVSSTSIALDMKCGDVLREQNSFDKLVTSLKETLGPSSGLTLEDVDVTSLMCLMELYNSRDCDWGRYAFGDSKTGYTRNLVDEGNGKGNLVCVLYSR